MINNIKLIDKDSDIYKTTAVVFLLYNYFKETEEEIFIFTSNAFMRDLILENLPNIQNHFDRKISVIVQEDLFKPKKTQIANLPVGKLLFDSYLVQEYIETPYFVEESNRVVYDASINLYKQPFSTLLVYGASGVGKSHLLNLAAYNAIKKGLSVYICNANKLIEDIKQNIKDKTINEHKAIFMQADVLCIDDFQAFNNANIAFTHAILFDIINSLMTKNKKIFIISDVSPYRFPAIHERIISRVMSGVAFELPVPTDNIKSQCIDHNCKDIPSDIKEFIITKSTTLREVKLLLNIYNLTRESGTLTVESFIKRVPQSFGSKVVSDKRKYIFDIQDILDNYFGVCFEKRTSKGRKGRCKANSHSVTYFVLFDKLEPNMLRSVLEIESKNHKYYYHKGKKLYECLPSAIQQEIASIVGGLKVGSINS